ncbi:MAG: hypothetical protein IPO81_09540 [Kouleothrix sp.]|nr:hypothetical protein [Kouleothrix sp.]
MATASSYDRLIRAARLAGVPRAQLENLLRAGYVAQPKQLKFHAAARRADDPDGPDEIGFGGARGPGKSHAVLGQLGADDCQRFPGLKALLLRKVGKAGREGFNDLLPKVFGGLAYKYTPSADPPTLTFPNGSRILVGHFQNEKDIDNYVGLEYDVIAVEEATQLSWAKYQSIRGSCRTSKSGWRPRVYSSTNPGGIGHGWYKARFVSSNDPTRLFIHATVDDNRHVNPEYLRVLNSYTGWQLRAWRHGDWDIAAGQFFTTFRREAHAIKPFLIPTDWRVWASMDYGWNHPQAMYLLAEDGDGSIYVVGEHKERNWLIPRHVDAFRALLGRHGVTPDRLWQFVAGTDVFASKDDGATIAQKYTAQGFSLAPANTDRINGAAEILAKLGDIDAKIKPKLKIFETCGHLLDCLPALQHDPHRPDDVLKVDADENGIGGDDEYDALRYGVMARYNPAADILDYYRDRAATLRSSSA